MPSFLVIPTACTHTIASPFSHQLQQYYIMCVRFKYFIYVYESSTIVVSYETCTYIYIYMHINIYVYIHIYKYICIYIYTHIYIYTYMYVYICAVLPCRPDCVHAHCQRPFSHQLFRYYIQLCLIKLRIYSHATLPTRSFPVLITAHIFITTPALFSSLSTLVSS